MLDYLPAISQAPVELHRADGIADRANQSRAGALSPQEITERLCLLERVNAYEPNENKMSDGGRERASLGMGVCKSSQTWNVRRSAVRSIAWLGLYGFS